MRRLTSFVDLIREIKARRWLTGSRILIRLIMAPAVVLKVNAGAIHLKFREPEPSLFNTGSCKTPITPALQTIENQTLLFRGSNKGLIVNDSLRQKTRFITDLNEQFLIYHLLLAISGPQTFIHIAILS